MNFFNTLVLYQSLIFIIKFEIHNEAENKLDIIFLICLSPNLILLWKMI